MVFNTFGVYVGVGGAGVCTQGLHLKPLHQPFFVKGFLQIGSHKLFAQAGFEQ
jgi:hypothetical protein